MKPFNRRRFLTTTLQAMAFAPLLGVRPGLADDTFRPLRKVAAEHGLSFGFAVDAAQVDTNASYRDVVARQASIVVPENALKWAQVHPAPDRYAFAPVDRIVAFAQENRQRMRGHTLCWHRALPDWVTRTATPANAKELLTQHIAAVVGRYRSKIFSWDNAAHLADPDAVLCYNDYGLESDSPAGTRKRAAVLALLRTMKQRGVPVHALGIQSHLRAADPHNFGPGLAAFLQQVHDLGLGIYITELDVDDSQLTGDVSQRDAVVADTYKRYLDLVLGTGTVSAVLTWGVWDTVHRTGATSSTGPSAQRPLVFGPQGTIKPASWVVEHCLAV